MSGTEPEVKMHAIQAVEEALEEVLNVVVAKNAIRKDSWLTTMSLKTMQQLVYNKQQRLAELYRLDVRRKDVGAEIRDELVDTIAYSAFQLYLIEREVADTDEPLKQPIPFPS